MSAAWAVHRRSTGQLVVVPLDDLAEHVIEGQCWCQPYEEDGVLIHNSADRREQRERRMDLALEPNHAKAH